MHSLANSHRVMAKRFYIGGLPNNIHVSDLLEQANRCSFSPLFFWVTDSESIEILYISLTAR